MSSTHLKDRVLETVYDAVDDFNLELPAERQIVKAAGSVLLGASGNLSSLDFVHFIVTAEERIEDRFGVPITLADERAMSQRSSPFRTLGTLVDYACSLLGEGHDD